MTADAAFKLPWDPDAEQAVLAGALIGADDLADVAGWLAPSDFHAEQHGAIWSAIRGLVEARQPVDMTTVRGALRDAQALDPQGMVSGILTHLAQALPETPGIAGQARVVRDLARRRAVVMFGRRMMHEGLTGEGPADVLVERMQQEALALSGPERSGTGPKPLSDTMRTVARENIARWRDPSLPFPGVPTGLIDLDEQLCGGMWRGDLVIVAGRPSMGKTSLAFRIACGVLAEGAPVLFFSQEQPAMQLALRAWAMESRTDLRELRRGRGFADEERIAAMEAAAERVASWGALLWIEDAPGRTPAQVRDTARRMCVRVGRPRLVVVDYLQIMALGTNGRRDDTRDREVGAATAALKGLARELDAPVLVLSQLNRSLESRSDKHPTMADLRDSGCIEQDADVICFIYREEAYNPTTPASAGIAEVNVAKQRNGPTGLVRLGFDATTTTFRNLAQSDRFGPEPAQRPEPVRQLRAKQRDWTERAENDA